MANVITNGTFDANVSGWDSGACTIASVAGGYSNNCCQITVVSGSEQFASQNLTLTPGREYFLSGWVKSGTSGNEAFGIYVAKSDWTWSQGVTGVTSGTWTQYSTVIVPPQASVVIYLFKKTSTSGTMLFDEIVLDDRQERTISSSIPVTLNFNSNVGLPKTVSSSISFPIQSIKGSMFTPRTVSGSIGIPIQQVDGTVLNQVTPSIEATLPSLGFTLQMSAVMSAKMDLQLPSLVFDVRSGATIIADLPELEFAVHGYTGDVLKLVNYLPRLSLSIHGLTGELAEIERDFPSLSLSIEASEKIAINNEWILPKIATNFHAVHGQMASISATLPELELSSNMWWTGPITLNIILPSLMANSRMTWSDFKTLVMNTRNFALTEYDNSFNYNSLAFYNGKLIMAKAGGIYEQTGSTDDGTQIDWKFKTGKIDTEKDILSKVRYAWISYRPDGDLLLTVSDGDNEYEYDITEYSLVDNAVKVKIGKGLKNRYLQLKVSNQNDAKTFFNHLRLFAEQTSSRR